MQVGNEEIAVTAGQMEMLGLDSNVCGYLLDLVENGNKGTCGGEDAAGGTDIEPDCNTSA